MLTEINDVLRLFLFHLSVWFSKYSLMIYYSAYLMNSVPIARAIVYVNFFY